jgi:hypothetical protein
MSYQVLLGILDNRFGSGLVLLILLYDCYHTTACSERMPFYLAFAWKTAKLQALSGNAVMKTMWAGKV